MTGITRTGGNARSVEPGRGEAEPPADVVAAGAVLWRPAPDGADGVAGPRVALVHRPRYDDWSLPKGKLDPGESVPAAAVREVAEETGMRALLGARLGETTYPVPQGQKVVHYWVAKAGDGQFTPGSEVDELRWLDLSAAERLLSYDRDREVLGRFRALGDPPPKPVLLVRHAKAGSREDWDGDDDLRPLTAKGRAQAHALTGLLRLFGPARAYTAPPLRCPQTIQPLADVLGLKIVEEPLLGEEIYWRDPDAGLARLLELAAGPDVPVLCSQGGVIPDVVGRLTGTQDPPNRKGSTWVLGFTDTRVITADYYPPPPTS
jgi:8-oxo-dGTP pyrophosphatase MutT (NUDIX family)/phosphohistidine phosphatase SixA